KRHGFAATNLDLAHEEKEEHEEQQHREPRNQDLLPNRGLLSPLVIGDDVVVFEDLKNLGVRGIAYRFKTIAIFLIQGRLKRACDQVIRLKGHVLDVPGLDLRDELAELNV